MEAIKSLIVDDERLARQRLRGLLALEPDIEVAGECATGAEAVEALKTASPDVMFLDVQMPELNGFAMLEAMNGSPMPLTVFVTAYDEYAIRAFEVGAVDYLLKPFDRERLQRALDRVRIRLRDHSSPEDDRRLVDLLEKLRTPRPDRLAVRDGAHLVMVKTDTIDWIEAADNYVCLHCGPVTHVMRETMNGIETMLDDAIFVRIHRSTIVNMDRIKELQPWFRGDYRVILQDGTVLTLSRTYREKVQSKLLRWA